MKVNVTISLDRSDYDRGSNVAHYAGCLECRCAFMHALEMCILAAVSNPKTREMVRDLIDTRPVDLHVFNGSIDQYELVVNNMHLRKFGKCSRHKNVRKP
jgi:hypothetical protein